MRRKYVRRLKVFSSPQFYVPVWEYSQAIGIRTQLNGIVMKIKEADELS